jgi:hypothetical protein
MISQINLFSVPTFSFRVGAGAKKYSKILISLNSPFKNDLEGDGWRTVGAKGPKAGLVPELHLILCRILAEHRIQYTVKKG